MVRGANGRNRPFDRHMVYNIRARLSYMKRYYAVQVGDYYACDIGSTVKRNAFRMARRAAKQNPGYEVRIVLCTTDDDFIDDVIYIQRGWAGRWWNGESKKSPTGDYSQAD